MFKIIPIVAVLIACNEPKPASNQKQIDSLEIILSQPMNPSPVKEKKSHFNFGEIIGKWQVYGIYFSPDGSNNKYIVKDLNNMNKPGEFFNESVLIEYQKSLVNGTK